MCESNIQREAGWNEKLVSAYNFFVQKKCGGASCDKKLRHFVTCNNVAKLSAFNII